MAYITSQNTGRLGSLGSWLERRVDSIRETMRRRRVYEQTYSELMALSQRELDDIGIGRGDISRIAHDTAARA